MTTPLIDRITDDAGLMHREMQFRAVDTESREITGIGVPYGETYTIWPGLEERFEPGAIDPADQPVLYWRHHEVIGPITAQQDVPEGHRITARCSKTTQGNDAWELVKDGAVRAFSIGFIPVEWRVETAEDGTETIIHTKVKTREFSLAPNPAYTGAVVESHRHAGTTPPRVKETPVEPDVITRADLDSATAGLTEQIRELAANRDSTPAGHPLAAAVAQFRGVADFVQAVARQDETALMLHRELFDREAPANALADTVVKDSWIGDFTRLVDQRRRLVNTFRRLPLPEKGMKIEYGKLTSDTTNVDTQANEGDELAGPGKVVIEIDSADVFTEGGYSSLSFQALQRATLPTINTLWTAMGMKYGRRTNQRVTNEYFKALDERAARFAAGDDLAGLAGPAAGTDSADWLDMVVDAALIFEEQGFVIGGMHASVDQFKRLNRLTDGDGRRLMRVWGEGMNMVGELNLSTVDGSLANVHVQLVGDRKTRDRLAFYDPEAIVTMESPGAPVQLQDENIITLTKQISLYGHVAVAVPFPEALLPVSTGTPAPAALVDPAGA